MKQPKNSLDALSAQETLLAQYAQLLKRERARINREVKDAGREVKLLVDEQTRLAEEGKKLQAQIAAFNAAMKETPAKT